MAQASIFSQAQYKNPALVQNAFNHMTYLEDRALEKQHTPDFERLSPKSLSTSSTESRKNR